MTSEQVNEELQLLLAESGHIIVPIGKCNDLEK
jgi:hypothetical protein